MTKSLKLAADDAVAWVRDLALPLWADAGFDGLHGRFHERLTFDRQPVLGIPLRSMVQARQISVFAHAALLGWSARGADRALQAADTLVRCYAPASQGDGMSFAIDPNGTPLGPFDLYAQAFCLFGLAWAMRLDPRPAYRDAVEGILAHLDTRRADSEHGGWWDLDPRPDRFRRQNPHMHMFEALLELYETTGDPSYLDRLAALRTLFEDRLCVAPGRVVHELYDDSWKVADPLVEPGHCLEWSWLLCRHDRHLGTPSALADHLHDHAVATGLDPRTGRVLDEVTAAGGILKATSRSWPHTEAIKAITTQCERGRGDTDILLRVTERLRTVYARDDLKGGWVDQVDEDDSPVSSSMPASTFYHLFLAVTELTRIADRVP